MLFADGLARVPASSGAGGLEGSQTGKSLARLRNGQPVVQAYLLQRRSADPEPRGAFAQRNWRGLDNGTSTWFCSVSVHQGRQKQSYVTTYLNQWVATDSRNLELKPSLQIQP